MKRLEGSLGRRCMASELQIVVLVLSSDAGRSQTMCEGGVGFFRLQCSVGARPSATGRGTIAPSSQSLICPRYVAGVRVRLAYGLCTLPYVAAAPTGPPPVPLGSVYPRANLQLRR